MSNELLGSHDENGLSSLVGKLISLKHEGRFWDFKREWHSNNAELLHDIICLANNTKGDTGFLIIGIDEENEYCPYDVAEHCEHRKNTQMVIDVLRSSHWAEDHPNVKVENVSHNGAVLDVVIVEPDRGAIPYYLMRDKRDGKVALRAGAIYTRTNDCNTPVNETASALDAMRLWQRRFGLEQTPREKIPCLLADHEAWVETADTLGHEPEAFTEAYYHSQNPEYVFTEQPDDRRDAWEYFMLNIPFFKEPSWYVVRFFYHQTMLYECLGMYLDHHFVGVPSLGTFQRPGTYGFDNRVAYRYYIAGSIEEQIGRFSLQKEGHDSEAAHRSLLEVVPVFEDERERRSFENYVANNWDVMESMKEGITLFLNKPRFVPCNYREDFADILEQEARYAAALVEMLQMYRGVQITE